MNVTDLLFVSIEHHQGSLCPTVTNSPPFLHPFVFLPSFVSTLTLHPLVIRVTFKLHTASYKSLPDCPQPTFAEACVVALASNSFKYQRELHFSKSWSSFAALTVQHHADTKS